MQKMIKREAIKNVKPQRASAKRRKPEGTITKTSRVQRKRVTFIYDAKPGSRVYLAGSFNNWDPSSHPLSQRNDPGTQAVMVLLSLGRHEYKFIVDGQWLSDPFCVNAVPDGHGAENSVIEVS